MCENESNYLHPYLLLQECLRAACLALCFFYCLQTILPIMWRTVLFTFSLTISKFSALLPIRLCKMTTHCFTGVTLTVSNSTQKNVKLSILEAMISLHNFCLGPNTCRLSIRSKIWVLLYPALYHGNSMLNQNFLNATEFSASSNEVFPSLCLVVENSFFTNPLSCLFYFTVPLPGLLI